MRDLKFRQPLWDKHNKFLRWHYWGFIDNQFIEPDFTPASSLKEAREQSQQYTGLKDKKGKGKEAYHHDFIKIDVSAPWDDEVLITVKGEILWKDAMWWFQSFESSEWTGPLLNLGYFEIFGNRYETPKPKESKNQAAS